MPKVYPLRIARSANGIRAQDLRSLNRGSWWARRWLSMLEAMRLGPRLGRARQYATNGQVMRLEISGSRVEAECVGSRPIPYQMSLEFLPLAAPVRRKVERALKAEPMLLARLVNGDLPIEVEELFRAQLAPLFPNTPGLPLPAGRKFDVQMHCSCPDWARPCKHLTAVMLLLGEEIAARPATLLALRGIDVFTLLPPAGKYSASAHKIPAAPLSPQLLPHLSPLPFWRGSTKFTDAIERIVTRVTPVARAALSAQSIDLRTR